MQNLISQLSRPVGEAAGAEPYIEEAHVYAHRYYSAKQTIDNYGPGLIPANLWAKLLSAKIALGEVLRDSAVFAFVVGDGAVLMADTTTGELEISIDGVV